MDEQSSAAGQPAAKPLARMKMQRINGVNKFPVEIRRANMKHAFQRGLPEVTVLKQCEAGHDAIVIGGGPSIQGEVETIRNLILRGCVVVTCERMYAWCLLHGIIPDYVVTMDASDDVVQAFDDLQPGSTHLVASQCLPEVFDALDGEKVYLYSTPQTGIEVSEFWEMGDYPSVTVINGGGSVVLCSMSLAMTLGMRSLHIFGFDCHVTAGRYAKGIVGVGQTEQLMIQAHIENRTYLTTVPYLCFAQQFFEIKYLATQLNECDKFKVYGDSLVTAMSRESIGA
jgi:hypothetical protein